MPQNLLNIGSGNGLLPDGTKPLPELWISIEIPARTNAD